MNMDEAKKVLDMARMGLNLPTEVIDQALYMTGDNPDSLPLPTQEMADFLDCLRREGWL